MFAHFLCECMFPELITNNCNCYWVNRVPWVSVAHRDIQEPQEWRYSKTCKKLFSWCFNRNGINYWSLILLLVITVFCYVTYYHDMYLFVTSVLYRLKGCCCSCINVTYLCINCTWWLCSSTGTTRSHWSPGSRGPTGTERRDRSPGQTWTSWPQG